MKSLVWRTWYRRWPAGPAARTPGYSLLVPVPGDLPVFLEIALAVARQQDPEHRVETLVVPDQATDRIRAIVATHAKDWPGPLRLVTLPWPDRWVPRYLNRPHHNHWLQLVNGTQSANATHALLHDADLFLADRRFSRQQFERCREGNYACFGVHRVWDPWFEQQGRHLTATWEMFFEVDWLRSFPPHLHLGHDDTLDGQRHTFDTTLFPQCQTPPERIGWHSPAGGLIHFNYVICSYRYFKAAKRPYADDQFRILLIRMLMDLFESAAGAEVPSLAELTRGLTDSAARVVYPGSARCNYREFRGKFEELLDSGFLTPAQVILARNYLGPFDAHFISA